MVSSILTNNGAMTALQSLKATQKSLQQTQNHISTGLKVGSAKDNAATWAVATAMRSDIANFKQVSENLSTSSSIVSTAQSGAEQVTDLVKQVRVLVASAKDPSKDKGQIQSEISNLLNQISSTLDTSAYKGVNLLNNAGSQKVLASINNVDGSSQATYMEVSNQDLRLAAGSGLSSLKDLTVQSRGDQVMKNATDGTEKVKVTVGASGAALKAGNEVWVNYIKTNDDGTTTDQVLKVRLSNDVDTDRQLVAALNADDTFSSMFAAEETGTPGDIYLTTKNRDVTARLGKTTAGAVDTDGLIIGKGGSGPAYAAGGLLTALDGGVRVSEVTFKDQAMKVGDEFTMKTQYTPGDETTIETYTLRVVDGGQATGKLLSDEDPNDKNYVIAVNFSEVSGSAVTGAVIAQRLAAALQTATGASGEIANLRFTAAAATAAGGAPTPHAAASVASFQAIESNGKFVVSTFDDTADVLSFNSAETDFESLLSKVDEAANVATNAAAAFGTAGKRIDMQKEFLDKLTDTLTSGVGALVDADMSEEAARLQALQVQEQLGTQALSIANQAPQSILSLFK